MADFTVENHGTIFLVRPLTAEARAWLDSNVVAEPYQWFGPALAVEHRYIENLVEGMTAEGFEVDDACW